MIVFKTLIYLFAAICFATGTADILNGLPEAKLANGDSVDMGTLNAAADNAFRFFSGVWFGAGILFVLFVSNLEKYKNAMIALLMVMAIGGVGRVFSILDHGNPGDTVVYVGLFIEFIVCPIMAIWLLRAKNLS